jgi:hypothetical protein
MVEVWLLAMLRNLRHVFGEYVRELHRTFFGCRSSARERLICDPPDFGHNILVKEVCKMLP